MFILLDEFFLFRKNFYLTLQYFEKMLLEVPKCEMFDHMDFRDFYTIKPPWVGDFGDCS
jgi:hypothetical protein